MARKGYEKDIKDGVKMMSMTRDEKNNYQRQQMMKESRARRAEHLKRQKMKGK